MLARLVDAIYRTARSPHASLAAAGVTIVVLLALGAQGSSAVLWGFLVFIAFELMQWVLQDEKAKWPNVYAVVAFAAFLLYLIVTNVWS